MKIARTCATLGAVLSVGWALCLVADRLASVLDAGFLALL